MKRFLKSLVTVLSRGRKTCHSLSDTRRATLQVENLEGRDLPSVATVAPIVPIIEALQVNSDVGQIKVTPQNSGYIQAVQTLAQKTVVDELAGHYTDAWHDTELLGLILLAQYAQSPATSLVNQNNLGTDAARLCQDAFNVYWTHPAQGSGGNTVVSYGNVGFNANGQPTVNGVTVTPNTAMGMMGIPVVGASSNPDAALANALFFAQLGGASPTGK